MRIKTVNSLSFDDVWLEPQYSTIRSRANPILTSRLTEGVTLKHPVIASNMASVVGPEMVDVLDKSGSIAFLHRFLNKDELIKLAKQKSNLTYFPFSIGIKECDYDSASQLYDLLGPFKPIVLVDIAHAHTKIMGEFLERVVKIGFENIVAGNIATPEGYLYLVEHGAKAVRVGVAGGKVCTTKYVTGHHVPTLQSVINISKIKSSVPIIADGGIRTSGDATKALAAGADFVCVGSVLTGTNEAPGERIQINGQMMKAYYGMSSQTAIDQFFGGKKCHVAPEGKTEYVPCTGPAAEVLDQFLAGIRSAMTYSGANTIIELQNKAVFLTTK